MTVTLALHDGRAGNARQAIALAGALDADAAEIALLPRAPWRWLAPRRLPASTYAFGDAYRRLAGDPPRLAIGCGRQAALATRVLRAQGSTVVQILDPRIDPRHWDVVVAPEHDGLRGDNVVSMLGSLHPVDDPWLAQARHDFPALAQWPAPHTVLLVGGPSRHAALTDAGFEALLQHLSERATADGGSLSMVASRRTPSSWRHAMACLPRELPGIRWLGDQDGRNPYAGLLGHADRIVCTPDSVNMLSEAAATRAHVFAWMPHAVTGRPRCFIDTMIERGHIHALENGSPIPTPSRQPLRETARVANAIRRHLGLPG